MSNTNLPPNLDGAISNAASRFDDLSSEVGQQVKLTKAFNKQLGGFVDKLKNSNDVFGNLKDPLEALRKSINALNKTMIASARVGIAGIKEKGFGPGRGPVVGYLRSLIDGLGPPSDPPGGGPNPGPGGGDRDPWYKKFLDRFERISRDNIEAMKGVVNSNIKYFNITDNIVKAYKNFEKLNEKSLAMGVSYERFINANSEALDNSRVGQQQLLEVMVSNFGAGIRMNSKELRNLNEEMIATGQDTQALQAVNSNLLALTGKDAEVVNSLIRVNQRVSDEYQISNDRLVQTMQNLSEVFDQASFFGSDAVKAVGTLGQELQGIVGVDMPRELNTAISLLMPSIENIAVRQRMGLAGVEDKLVNNTISLQDIMPGLRRILQVRDEQRQKNVNTANEIAAGIMLMSENQFNQMARLADAVVNGNNFQSDVAKQREEEFNQVKVLREKQLDYFTNIGPDTYRAVQEITPAVNKISLAINMLATAQGLGNIGGMEGLGAGFKGGLKAAGKRLAGGSLVGLGMTALDYAQNPDQVSLGGAGGTVAGAALGQALIPIPVVGAMIGGYIGNTIGEYFDPIEENTKKTADALKKQNDAKAEELRHARAAANKQEMDKLSYLASYLRREGELVADPSDKLVEVMEKLVEEMALTRKSANSNRKGTVAPGNR